ncbi:MAG: 30S ribosomal protein S3 [Proteobacteria bacterium SW_6_67_9]|jgi:small subunit ribosomal protein S3|nr:MAG: 30S ribosomal protein S3 [Proteobacteria bacterium SW_6_67_9]
MGQKVHPVGIRLGIATDWNSTWYANNRDFPEFLNNDIAVRDFIRKELAHASVSRIQIDRPARALHVTIHTARPGIVIGKKGEDIEKLRHKVAQIGNLPVGSVKINIAEIRKPELDAKLVADNVAAQLERRVMFRRAMKRVVTNTMRLGAEGVKIHAAGRLNGAEIARKEWYHDGRVPLHTLRADIDFGQATARTAYGTLGLKVWICKGEVFDLTQKREAAKSQAQAK